MATFDFAQAAVGVSAANGTLTDLPGATTTVTIPAGHTGRLEIAFNAESACSGGSASFLFGPWCEVHVIVDGTDVFGGGARL